jgi:hypothetical protein
VRFQVRVILFLASLLLFAYVSPQAFAAESIEIVLMDGYWPGVIHSPYRAKEAYYGTNVDDLYDKLRGGAKPYAFRFEYSHQLWSRGEYLTSLKPRVIVAGLTAFSSDPSKENPYRLGLQLLKDLLLKPLAPTSINFVIYHPRLTYYKPEAVENQAVATLYQELCHSIGRDNTSCPSRLRMVFIGQQASAFLEPAFVNRLREAIDALTDVPALKKGGRQ